MTTHYLRAIYCSDNRKAAKNDELSSEVTYHVSMNGLQYTQSLTEQAVLTGMPVLQSFLTFGNDPYLYDEMR